MTAFCDWLSVYQIHPSGSLPVVNNGHVWSVDRDGKVEWTTQRKFEHVGSYRTGVRLKCDGHMVAIDGNIGRLDRPDNVFGFSVQECVEKASDLAQRFGLPRFSAAQRMQAASRKDNFIAQGAILTRIDLTQNYAAGSKSNAERLVHYMAGQGSLRSRSAPKAYGTSGVSWNEGSKWWYAKLYRKAEEMGQFADEELRKWVDTYGMVRHEVSLKSRYLTQRGLRYLRAWQSAKGAMAMEKVVYGKFADVLTRNTVATIPFECIEGRIGRLARDWMNGRDVWGEATVSKETKRRWRRELLPYGIDIKLPCDVTRLGTRCEVITLAPMQPEQWYWDLQAKVAEAA